MRVNRTVAAAVGLSVAAGGGSSAANRTCHDRTGSAPCGAVVGYRSVWIANDGGSFVTLRAHGSIWVTNFALTDVRRFRP